MKERVTQVAVVAGAKVHVVLPEVTLAAGGMREYPHGAAGTLTGRVCDNMNSLAEVRFEEHFFRQDHKGRIVKPSVTDSNKQMFIPRCLLRDRPEVGPKLDIKVVAPIED